MSSPSRSPWYRVLGIWAVVATATLPLPAAEPTDSTPPASSQPVALAVATKALDLRTLPLIEGSDTPQTRQVGKLVLDVKGKAAPTFDFYVKQLTDRGWKGLPASPDEENSTIRVFEKDGLRTGLSVQELGDSSLVMLVQYGNVSPDSLPVPARAKLIFKDPSKASYASFMPVDLAKKTCKDLLVAQHWQPCGSTEFGGDCYLQNGMVLILSAEEVNLPDGQTTITYFPELASAELAVMPDAENTSYVDLVKTLRFRTPSSKQLVFGFYRAWLANHGWTSDQTKMLQEGDNEFAIFQNTAGDRLMFQIGESEGLRSIMMQIKSRDEFAEDREKPRPE